MSKNDELVKNWLAKAKHDLLAAKKELASEGPLTDIACFHCQQSTEKCLKAYLISRNINFPKTHILEDLLSLCFKTDDSFNSFNDVIGELTGYAVDIRYGDDFYIPSINEAKEALEIAEDVSSFVKNKIELKNET